MPNINRNVCKKGFLSDGILSYQLNTKFIVHSNGRQFRFVTLNN